MLVAGKISTKRGRLGQRLVKYIKIRRIKTELIQWPVVPIQMAWNLLMGNECILIFFDLASHKLWGSTMLGTQLSIK